MIIKIMKIYVKILKHIITRFFILSIYDLYDEVTLSFVKYAFI